MTGAVAQLAERLRCNLNFEGSTPHPHPRFPKSYQKLKKILQVAAFFAPPSALREKSEIWSAQCQYNLIG